jgi:LysM repeat protein
MSAVTNREWHHSAVSVSQNAVQPRSVIFPDARHSTKTVMKLTARGKAFFGGLGAAALVMAAMAVWDGNVAQSAVPSQQVTSYVVRPGDTLWSYAQEVTKPGEDIRETVQQLMELNNMEVAAVNVGQRLVVPVRS